MVTAAADLTSAFWRNREAVREWTRTVELVGTTLRVIDTCQVGAGVRPVFQLQVPVVPVQLANGTIAAGNMTIRSLQPATASWSAMPPDEFSRGYRIDLVSTVGCSFSVELRAQ